jgi:hypothetical protein
METAIDWKIFLVVHGETLNYTVWRDNRLGVSKHKMFSGGEEVQTIFRRDGDGRKFTTESALMQDLNR